MKNCNSIFFSKVYAEFIENTEKTKVNWFKFTENQNFACFPYVLKDGVLSSLRYGGIYTNCGKAHFSKRLQSFLSEYCKKNNIKKVQIRENPFIKTVNIGKVAKKEPFVYVDLKKSNQQLKEEISKSHARCTQKAIKQGLTFCEVQDLKYLKTFYKFYKDVLSKKGLVPHKFFYFAKLFSHLKNNLQLACIKHEEAVIAVSIILTSDKNAFMLYGGMNEAGYEKCAKHFMIHSLIFGYKKKGYKRLVLGTGHNGRDSIYRFKRGFTDKDNYIYTYEYQI